MAETRPVIFTLHQVLDTQHGGLPASAFEYPLGPIVQVNWGLLLPFCFRAEKGQVDVWRETFWRVATSLRLNPVWQRLYESVQQQLKAMFDQAIQMGYAQIQAAGAASRAISANNDAMLQALEQQRMVARTPPPSSNRSPTDDFDEYIRGVRTYEDPCYGESQQDNNFSYHWTDGQGEYRHSNDPLYNPNLDSPKNWTVMIPKT